MTSKGKALCVSCKEEISSLGVIFKCPKCGKQDIPRCTKCRQLSSVYVCTHCNFTGP